jgi:hypothetical protein
VGLDRQSGNSEDDLTLDEMLDNIMLYWLPGEIRDCFAKVR